MRRGAIVWAIQKFMSYLEGYYFKVETDLMTQK